MASRPVHFEISADNPSRVIDFYNKVFGWQFNRWGDEEYWLVKTGEQNEPGIDGGLFLRKGQVGHVNTISVDSIDDAMNKVESSGGKVVVPKRAIPGVGWLAYCQDTEESVFGIMESDTAAK